MKTPKKTLFIFLVSVVMAFSCFADETIRVTAVGKAPLSLGVAKARSMAMVVAQQAAIEEATGVLVTKMDDGEQYRVKLKSKGKVLSYSIINEESAKDLYEVTIQADVLFEGITAKVQQQQNDSVVADGYKSYTVENENGSINWESGVIKVLGDGVDSAGNKAKARRAALADAYANAFEFIKIINVNSSAKVSELVSDKTIYNALQTSIRGARIATEGFNEQRNKYEVTLEIPIWGVGGINKAFMKVERKASKPTPEPVAPIAAVVDAKESTLSDTTTLSPEEETNESLLEDSSESEQEYTGIVVDAQEFEAEPAIFPTFVSQSGEPVYSADMADEKQLEDVGMAAYVTETEEEEGLGQGYLDWRKRSIPSPQFASLFTPHYQKEATIFSLAICADTNSAKPRLKRRAGTNPLVVKAVSSQGENKSTIVISNEDAEKIKNNEAIQKQLSACNVVIVLKSEAGGTEGRILFRGQQLAHRYNNAME